MWEILEHRRLEKQIKSLPLEIRKRYEFWKNVVSVSGPDGLRRFRGFKDEALQGQWNGYRSSRLNRQYRVIYMVFEREVLIEVVSITAHDYRKK